MDFKIMHITLFGQAVILLLLVTTISFWRKKKPISLLATVFPFFTILESFVVGWRWDHPQLFYSSLGYVWAGMPSFLIAIGFTFIGYYLHLVLPESWKRGLDQANIFPFSNAKYLEPNSILKYFRVGLWYSVATLLLHEASQYLEISARNTFDWVDFVAIVIGSVVSVIVFFIFRQSQP